MRSGEFRRRSQPARRLLSRRGQLGLTLALGHTLALALTLALPLALVQVIETSEDDSKARLSASLAEILSAGALHFDQAPDHHRTPPNLHASDGASLVWVLSAGARRTGGEAVWEQLVAYLIELQEKAAKKLERLTGWCEGSRHESRCMREAALAELATQSWLNGPPTAAVAA